MNLHGNFFGVGVKNVLIQGTVAIFLYQQPTTLKPSNQRERRMVGSLMKREREKIVIEFKIQ